MAGQSNSNHKILYLITQGEMGGAQKYVLDLSTNLPSDYQAIVAVGLGNNELKDELQRKNVAVVELNHLKREINPIEDLKALTEIKQLINKIQPDLIHLNSSKAGFLGSLAAKQLRFDNVIFTAHGFAFLEPQNFPRKQIYLRAEQAARSWRKKIITVSEHDRQEALKRNVGQQKQIITIPTGIDFQKIELIERAEAKKFIQTKIGQAGNHKIIGAIANLYKTKGLEYLVEAAADLVETNQQLIFTVIGEGKERKNLESLITKFKLTSHFYLIGGMKNAAQYLKAFDIFVLPSVKEGTPYTILEAAFAGLPIVATKVGGIPDALEDQKSALLVPSKNPVKLAAAIKLLLLDQKLAEELGDQAKQAAKNFSLEKMIKKTLEVYQECWGS